jgi:hypothetical protein
MDGLKLVACVRERWPPIHIIITTGNVRPREIPANALFIPKPYVGRTVIDAMRARLRICSVACRKGCSLFPRFHFPGASLEQFGGRVL